MLDEGLEALLCEGHEPRPGQELELSGVLVKDNVQAQEVAPAENLGDQEREHYSSPGGMQVLVSVVKKGVDIGGFFQYLGNGIFSFFPKWLVKVDIQVVRI